MKKAARAAVRGTGGEYDGFAHLINTDKKG